MLTGSLEYQYRLSGNWWLATFTDYGSAWDDTPDWVQGVGAGVRWASPIGPIRIDVASGISDDSHPIRVHFFIGSLL